MKNYLKILPILLGGFLGLYSLRNAISGEINKNSLSNSENLTEKVEQGYPNGLTEEVKKVNFGKSGLSDLDYIEIKDRIEETLIYESATLFKPARKKLESIVKDYPKYEEIDMIKKRIEQLKKLE